MYVRRGRVGARWAGWTGNLELAGTTAIRPEGVTAWWDFSNPSCVTVDANRRITEVRDIHDLGPTLSQATQANQPLLTSAGFEENFLLWSNDLSQDAWTKTNVTVSAQGDVVTADAGNVVHQVVQGGPTAVGGLDYWIDLEVERINYDYVLFYAYDGSTYRYMVADLVNGVCTGHGTSYDVINIVQRIDDTHFCLTMDYHPPATVGAVQIGVAFAASSDTAPTAHDLAGTEQVGIDGVYFRRQADSAAGFGALTRTPTAGAAILSGISGRPAACFDGSDDFLGGCQASDLISAAGFDCLAVFETQDIANGADAYVFKTASEAFSLTVNNNWPKLASYDSAPRTASANNRARLMRGSHFDGLLRTYGATVSAGKANCASTTNLASPFTLGADANAGRMMLGELIIKSSKFTDAEYAALESYLCAKWGAEAIDPRAFVEEGEDG